MNPIFKVTNGVYVDLSKIIAIRFDVEDRSKSMHTDSMHRACDILGVLKIQYEKTPEQMMAVPSNSDFGQVIIVENISSLYGSRWTFEDLYLGKTIIEGADFKRLTDGDPIKAIEDFRVKFEAKYKYVLDAWEQYKMYIEHRIGF